MASLDANENAPTPKRVCKPAQNPSKPARTPPPKSADNEPLAKIDRENFFGSISLKPNGLFDLPDLNEHFDKQLNEVILVSMGEVGCVFPIVNVSLVVRR